MHGFYEYRIFTSNVIFRSLQSDIKKRGKLLIGIALLHRVATFEPSPGRIHLAEIMINKHTRLQTFFTDANHTYAFWMQSIMPPQSSRIDLFSFSFFFFFALHFRSIFSGNNVDVLVDVHCRRRTVRLSSLRIDSIGSSLFSRQYTFFETAVVNIGSSSCGGNDFIVPAPGSST